MSKTIRSLFPILVAGLMVAVPAIVMPPSAAAFQQSKFSDADLAAAVKNNALNKSQFKNIQVSAHNGVVTLTGTVNVVETKEQADHRVHGVKGVQAVDNQIQIAGPEVPDAKLQQELLKEIEYSRVGYGTTAFNAISVSVQNGVVTLGGHAYGPVDADTADSIAENTKGVKDVINNIQVDPVSPMDDRIRIAEYRAIYGFPSLNRYAIDPAQPIRISVQNGNVTLYGTVDSQADKNTAGIRANTVPGVFHVTNDLQVAGQHPEKTQQ